MGEPALHPHWEPGFKHRWFWFGGPELNLNEAVWAICCVPELEQVALIPDWKFVEFPPDSELWPLARNCDQAQPVVDWLLEFAPPEFADRLGSLIGKGVGL